MKENWIIKNYGCGLFIYVYNFKNINEINNASYKEKLKRHDEVIDSYCIGMWKPKHIKNGNK